MDAVLHKISREEALKHLPLTNEQVKSIIAMTAMFYGGFVGGRLALIAGIVVESLLEDEAYLWMHHEQDVIDQVPVTFARMAKRFVDELPYLLIRGHTAEPFIPFIKFLGGNIIDEAINTLIPFEIRKLTHG